MSERKTHEVLRVLVNGDIVAVQPADASGNEVTTLSVDLVSCDVHVTQAPKLGSGATEVLALVGVFTFRAGAVLAAVTQAEQVAELYGQPVYRVAETQLYKPTAKFDAGEQRLLGYLHDALNPVGAGRNLFFAYQLDLTLTAQALSDVLGSPASAAKSVASRADKRFFWNRVMAAPIMDAGGDPFVLPMIVGSVAQLADVQATAHGKSVTLCISLIARRALDRAGTRHWRRGADTQGHVANFVETEQLVTLDGGRVVASYVQCRGSMPLLWSQIPNIKYKPTTRIMNGGASTTAFDAHFDALINKYKGVSCINLVDHKKSEGVLEKAFAAEAKRYASSRSAALTYTPFDFHKECGTKNYERLALLWNRVQQEAGSFGQFLTGTQHNNRQEGVFRTNCVDCLDRTNVVQGLLGRHQLENLLTELGVLKPGEDLVNTMPKLDYLFKNLWADHGDDIARQYAGTGALKSGFTRTGKRSLGGLVDDGVKSMVRYYLNNFQDGHKQDALDLISGAYKVKRDVRLRFQRQHSPFVPVLLALLSLGYALHSLTLVLKGVLGSSSSVGGLGSSSRGVSVSANKAGLGGLLSVLSRHVVAPLMLAFGLVVLVQKNGKMLVDRPQLCPQLANTVAYADKQQ